MHETVASLARRWSLTLGNPFEGSSGGCVMPATRADGSAAVLKLARRHFEGADEIRGLRFWAGDAMVRLLDADEEAGAMLLERCDPGTPLRQLAEEEQDVVIARILRRLWRRPEEPGSFRPLSLMLDVWSAETATQRAAWPDAGLVREGLALLATLSRSARDLVLLATDLHAGNVLMARREPWLAIDPKPFVGDRCYDATQHLLNCPERLRRNPGDAIRRLADLLNVDADRVRMWTFARLAAAPREDWGDGIFELARGCRP